MTKEFENFKNELNLLNQSEERNRNLKIENFKNQIDHDKKILKESGVIELFQNIRDSQIVSSEETIKEPVYKESFFGSRKANGYVEKTIKKPAEIIFSDNYSSNYDYSKCLNQSENNISISLIFNHIYDYGEWGNLEGGHCQFVKVVVKNNHLNLLTRNYSYTGIIKNTKDTLIPIKTSELEKTIAWGIKNSASANYSKSLSDIANQEFY